MAIRYDKKLNQEINRTIKNFNQKIARLEKSDRELLLPNKVTKQELLTNIYDRTDLRKKLKELQRFSKRGAVVITAIRFDKKLNQEINRTIKNYNQKIARLEKSDRELLLPNKVTEQELLTNIYDRTDLRKKLKELQRFSKRGAEDIITLESGARISNYEYENIKIESRAIKARLTRQINRLKTEKIRIGGEKQDTTFAESGDKNYLNLVARREALNKHLAGLDEEHLILYKKLINKSKRNSRYYDNIFMGNYLESLSQIGEFYGYDANKIQEIKEKLLELDSKKFTRLFNEDQVIKAILDYNISPKSRKRKAGVNLLAVKDDVIELYDALYDKLDVILEEAK